MNSVREKLLHCLGMQKNLDVQPFDRSTVGHTSEQAFETTDLIYERWSVAGRRDRIPAWFVYPKGNEFPARTLLALHPHGRQFEVGKSLVAGLVGDGSRDYGRVATRHGFAVLMPDLPGFEDHRPPLAARKRSYALQGEAYERLLANQAVVQGTSVQAWTLEDVSACLDALGADERVNMARVGALGQSFGGQEVLFAMMVEDRIQAGVSSCGFSLIRLLIDNNISHNMALYVPGLLPDLDFDVLIPSIAPRPLRLIAGLNDAIYPIEGVRTVQKIASKTWAERGAADKLFFDLFEGGHDLPADRLEAALDWFQEVL